MTVDEAIAKVREVEDQAALRNEVKDRLGHAFGHLLAEYMPGHYEHPHPDEDSRCSHVRCQKVTT